MIALVLGSAVAAPPPLTLGDPEGLSVKPGLLFILHLDEVFVLGHAGCPLPNSSCDRPRELAESLRTLCALDEGSVVALSYTGDRISLVGAVAEDGPLTRLGHPAGWSPHPRSRSA